MRKWNENLNNNYLSHDKYKRNQINDNNQLVYPKNDSNLNNRIGVERNYHLNLNLGKNNYQAPNDKINYRNNTKKNNINSNPNHYLYSNDLGNSDIKKSNEDSYRKRYRYSYDNKKNAGDLYNQKEINEKDINVNKSEVNNNNANFQGFINRTQRKYHPTNNKEYRIKNCPESTNNQIIKIIENIFLMIKHVKTNLKMSL